MKQEQIKARREELENELEELERAEQRASAIAAFAKDIRADVDDNGWDVMEVVAAIAPEVVAHIEARPARKKANGQAAPRAYYRDPARPELVWKGALPAWAKQRMHEQGIDFEDKTARTRWREENLERVAA